MKHTHIFKQSLVLLLAVTFMLLLCACAGNAGNPGTPTMSTPAPSESPAQVSNTPAQSTAPAPTTPTMPSGVPPSGAANELTSWVGEYSFFEYSPPNQNLGYNITIYEDSGAFYAKINIEGFQTLSNLIAIIQGDKNSITFVFDSYDGDNNFQPYQQGDVLLTFERQNAGILTTWGKIIPMLPDQEPGYYFEPDGTQSSSTTPSPAPVAPSSPVASGAAALTAYRAILLDGAEFYSTNNINTDENQNITLNRLLQNSGSGDAMKVTRFAVIDLDRDGTPEVVLNCAADGTDYFTIVLHEQDGTVYGYNFYRADFSNLKADGTYSFSHYEPNYGFGVLECSGSSCMTDKITYREAHDSDGYTVVDPESASTVEYFVNHQSAAEDEFNAAMVAQQSKPDAAWYDFTAANIEAVLSRS